MGQRLLHIRVLFSFHLSFSNFLDLVVILLGAFLVVQRLTVVLFLKLL